MTIDIPYYEDNTRVSNSAIGWFLKRGPLYFHKMLTGEEEGEKGPQLERGTMIHSYILTPEEFQKDYVVWDKSRPLSAQQEKFCQALAFSTEIEPNRAILSAYKDAYSTAGKSEDKMLSEGLKIASTLKDYIDFLKANDGRIMITPSDYRMLEKIKQNVKSHKLANKLLQHETTVYEVSDWMPPVPSTKKEYAVYHEFHINWEWYGDEQNEDYPHVSCKSLLDSLTLDFKHKKVTIMDLKTTAKLWHFEESIEMYDYCRQLMYYTMAVCWYLKYELGEDLKAWSHEWYIIGIDTTGSNEIRVFKFTEGQIYLHADTIEHALEHIAWHQSAGKWDHSREYYEGDGSESLNL